MIHVRVFLLVATALVLAVGCGGGDGGSSKTAAEARPTDGHALFGSYRATLDTPDPAVPDGIWTLVLKPGQFTTAVTSSPQVNAGTLKITGTELTLTNETPACRDAVGRYRWSLEGRTLRLDVVGRDACSGNDRTVVLTSKPWTRRR